MCCGLGEIGAIEWSKRGRRILLTLTLGPGGEGRGGWSGEVELLVVRTKETDDIWAIYNVSKSC
jgi:hypothetical protein